MSTYASLFMGLCRNLSSRTVRPILNNAIRTIPRVRLISLSGEDFGLMSGAEALSRAKTAGCDVMQVARGAADAPAVVRFVDYKTLSENQRRKTYEMKKKQKEKRLKDRKEGGLKQLRLSPSTDTHDLLNKLRQAQQFLTDGYRVRLYMQFRRGQGRLLEQAKSTLVDAARSLSSYGIIRGVKDPSELQSVFQEPPQEAALDPAQAAKARKPLEVFFQPLPRRLREKQSTAGDNEMKD